MGEGPWFRPGTSVLLFFFAACLTSFKAHYQQSPLATGLDADVELTALIQDAHNALIRFATRKWAKHAPWLMLDAELCKFVGALPEGATLAEAFPREFGAFAPPAVVAAPSPVPPVVIAPPSAPSSAVSARVPTLSLDTSSHPRGLGRVLVPPSRTASRSPATASPAQTTPSPVVPPGVFPVSSHPPSAGSGAGAALPPTSGPAPSPSSVLPPAGPSRPVRARPVVVAADSSKVPRVRLSLFFPFCFLTLIF